MDSAFSFNESEWNNLCDELKDFVKICLAADLDQRPSIEELLRHDVMLQFKEGQLDKHQFHGSIGSDEAD